MMKNILKTLTFAAIFSLICSCTNTDVDDAYSQGLTILSASLSTETRTAYSGDTSVDVVWNEGDAITLYGSDGNLYQLSLYEGAGTSTALFVSYQELPFGVTFTAVYPATTAQSLEARESEWQTNLKSQTISSLEEGKLSKYAAMKGEVVNGAVSFEQETLLFRAVFDDATMPSGQVSISDSANEALNITLTIDSAAEGTTLYVAAQPGDYSSVTLSTVDYGFVKDINATLSAGTVVSLNLGEDDSVDELSFSNMADEDGATEYNITSAADLKLLSDKVSEGYTYYGVTFKLTRNIDLGGFDSNGDPIEDNQWVPIGNSTTNFKVTFDGCGYEVSGIYINSTSDYQGLFGYVGSSGSISNLGVSGSITGGTHVGGVVGASYSNVTNCYNTGKVSGSSYCVGGVVGYFSSFVTDCYNTGEVSGTSNVGGVIGYFSSSASSSSSATNCYNTGKVSGASNVGGVIGSFSTSSSSYFIYVTNCYNIGEVNGSSGLVGGIVGYFAGYYSSSSAVKDCCNTGNINGLYAVGGVVGASDYSYISDCYNIGEVTGSSYGVAGVVGISFYGSSVISCYNTGKVSGLSDGVGGVVGISDASTITNCYNIGKVNGVSDVGGVVGSSHYFTSVTNCYYLDTLTDLTSSYGVTETEENMKSADFVTTLNNGGTNWQSDYTPNINSGYPILSWQE